jgi:hypothetical protein
MLGTKVRAQGSWPSAVLSRCKRRACTPARSRIKLTQLVIRGPLVTKLNGHRLSRPLGCCFTGKLILASCNGSGIDLLFRGDHPERALSPELLHTITDAWRRHTLPGIYKLPALPIALDVRTMGIRARARYDVPRTALPPPQPTYWLCRLPPNREFQITNDGRQLIVSVSGVG